MLQYKASLFTGYKRL